MGDGPCLPQGQLQYSPPAHVLLCLGHAPCLGCSPKALVAALTARQPHGAGTGTVTAWQFGPTGAVQGC